MTLTPAQRRILHRMRTQQGCIKLEMEIFPGKTHYGPNRSTARYRTKILLVYVDEQGHSQEEIIQKKQTVRGLLDEHLIEREPGAALSSVYHITQLGKDRDAS